MSWSLGFVLRLFTISTGAFGKTPGPSDGVLNLPAFLKTREIVRDKERRA
jgi:hypothetical protein